MDIPSPEEIQRVHRFDCALNGHKLDFIYELGDSAPLAVTCSHCWTEWKIVEEAE